MHRLAAGIAAALGASLVASSSGVDATVSRSSGYMTRKSHAEVLEDEPGAGSQSALLGTLVQTHTEERVPLDMTLPSQERFSKLLEDRVTGEHHAFDPKLLELLRSLAKKHPGARFELVSGYRSPKLNETMRKKGHHVASHSQHSLGHAVDFRLVLPDAPPVGCRRGSVKDGTCDPINGMDPRDLELEIRGLRWEGGVGVYTLKDDWFVHADVGKLRRWAG
jgi:uncharacterized protein YcbK (DUF882 family)